MTQRRRSKHINLEYAHTNGAHRPAIGTEQAHLTREPTFAVGQRVILQSTGEEGEIVSEADALGYRVRVEFRGRKMLRYAHGYRLRAL